MDKMAVIIGSYLLNYTKMVSCEKDSTYTPPTKEEVIREYQNVPLFNRTVDTLISHFRHSESRGRICYCDMDKAIKLEICKKCRGIILPAA